MAASVRRRRKRRPARIVQIVAATLGIFIVVGAGLLAASVVIDDVRIDADRATATALVTDVSPRRAAISFTTETGQHVRPPEGVFYPTGLAEGQRIQVDYRRANPSLVRVSGRSWTVAAWPIASVVILGGGPCLLAYLGAGRVLRRSRAGGRSGGRSGADSLDEAHEDTHGTRDVNPGRQDVT